MLDVLRFWVDHGADGFRIDALRQTIKDDRWRDNPPNPAWREGDDPYAALIPEYTTDRDEVLELVALMRAAVGPDRALIGELYLPLERLVRYYGAGLDLPSNFHLISTPWEAEALGAHVAAFEALLPDGAWPNYVLGNHDRPRIATRVGAAQARVAAVLLLTLRGTPTLYYGDELGHARRARSRPTACRTRGSGACPACGRDPVRTPVRWRTRTERRLLPPGPSRGCRSARRGRQRGAQERDAGSLLAALPRAARAAPRRAMRSRSATGSACAPPTACSPTCAAGASWSRSTSPARSGRSHSTAARARSCRRARRAERARRRAAARPGDDARDRPARALSHTARHAHRPPVRARRRAADPRRRRGRRRTRGSPSASSTSPTRAARTSSRRTRCTRSSARSRPAPTCSSSTSG